MEMILYKGKAYKPCNHCKGTGTKSGFSHVQQGICFQCNGYKSQELYKEIKKEREAKEKLIHIEELKRSIAEYYLKLQNKDRVAKMPHIAEKYREQAKECYDILKNKYGIIFTLEEIQQKANDSQANL
jgi:hypothetical protein